MNEPKTPSPTKSMALKLGWIGIVIGIVALTMGAIALFAGFNHLHSLNRRQHIDKNNLVNLTAEVSALARNSALQAKEIAANQQHLQNVVVTNHRQDTDWVLTESSYLVRQAQFTLEFEQNPDLAEQLLKAADNRIASLNNPALLPVRQALTDNMQSLKAVPRVHMDSILLNINALGQQITTLPIVSNPQATKSNTVNTTQTATSGWKRSLLASWQALRQVIVVQYHPQLVNQLILPVNRGYLDIHLQMLLGQAMWAVLHHQPDIYQQSLRAADTWVSNYYLVEASATQAFKVTLQQLLQIQIAPPLPNLSSALIAINSAKVILISPPSEPNATVGK